MRSRSFTGFAILAFLFLVCKEPALAQHDRMQMAEGGFNLNYWFGVLEFPFLLIAVIYAFATARTLKGGKFGRGMNLIAWGFVVMAVGHLHMQIEHFYGINLFRKLLGEVPGNIAWFIALVLTWGLSGLGFHSIYKASKGE
jgi:hypothetical protein